MSTNTYLFTAKNPSTTMHVTSIESSSVLQKKKGGEGRGDKYKERSARYQKQNFQPRNKYIIYMSTHE